MEDVPFAFDNGSKGKVSWKALVLAISWIVLTERNRRIFKDKVKGGGSEMAIFLASLWASLDKKSKTFRYL